MGSNGETLLPINSGLTLKRWWSNLETCGSPDSSPSPQNPESPLKIFRNHDSQSHFLSNTYIVNSKAFTPTIPQISSLTCIIIQTCSHKSADISQSLCHTVLTLKQRASIKLGCNNMSLLLIGTLYVSIMALFSSISMLNY